VPLKWEGREISVIDLDFSKVKGSIINQCERETIMQGNLTGIVRSQSAEYCGRMAALISGVPFRALEKLLADDYDAVWQTVGAFVGKRINPQEFYDQFTSDNEEEDEKQGEDKKAGDAEAGFIPPAEKPVTVKKPEK